MKPMWVISLLLLTGCPFVGEAELDAIRDADGDGYENPAYGGQDCRDDLADVHPDRDDVPGNGLDDDCAGAVDDSDVDGVTDAEDCAPLDPAVQFPQTWYDDADRDGQASEVGTELCVPLSGMVDVQGGDCDDADDTVFTGADERCDGLDNDCDAQSDEGVPYNAWYFDADEDGAGDPLTSVSNCEVQAPEGYVGNADDCDDTDPDLSPSEDEICDGIDNDCDRAIDDGLVFQDWYPDADADDQGPGVLPISTCDGPPEPSYVLATGDCDDSDPTVYTGAPEICDGLDNGCTGGEPDEGLLFRPVYNDLDGDGHGRPVYGPYPSITRTCEATAGEGLSFTDDDCDDDDAEVVTFTFWHDRDGDGYGNPAEHVNDTCIPFDDLVDDDTDCDDQDPDENPAAVWFLDGDGDGQGDPDTRVADCERPTNGVLDGTDCDDDDPLVYFGAPGELPHDGLDRNCDQGTDLDADLDGLPDFAHPACTPDKVQPAAADPGTLQSVLDDLAAAGKCGFVTLAGGVYGPIVVRHPLALIAAPDAEVVFASELGFGTAIEVDKDGFADNELLLERLSFEAWATAVHTVSGSVTMSTVRVAGGVVVQLDDPGGIDEELRLYDARFDGVETVNEWQWSGGSGFDRLELQRSKVSNAVAPASVLLAAGKNTAIDGLTIEHSAALDTMIRLPLNNSGTQVFRNVEVLDSLGPVLTGQMSGGSLDLIDWTVASDIAVDRSLVLLIGPTTDLRIDGMTAYANEVQRYAPIDLNQTAMFDLQMPFEITASRFLGNLPDEVWLLQGGGTLQGSVLAGSVGRGVRMNGVIDHSTLVGFREEPVESWLAGDLTVSSSLLADLGRAIPLTVVLDDTLLDPATTSGCGVRPNCAEGPVDFLRYDRDLIPWIYWDFRVFPESLAYPAVAGPAPFGAFTAADYVDADGDDLYDSWEQSELGGDVDRSSDQDLDTSDAWEEFRGGTLPYDPDCDDDGLPDGADTQPWDPSRP